MELINKKLVLKIINDMTVDEGDYKRCTNLIEQLNVIESRPKGEWIGIEYDGYADGLPVWELWECSECGIETKEETPFCAYCGADMRGDIE